MKQPVIIQHLFSITWLAALRRAAEQWRRKYLYYLSRFLEIRYSPPHINIANPQQGPVSYNYFKKAITDHTGLSGFVRG